MSARTEIQSEGEFVRFKREEQTSLEKGMEVVNRSSSQGSSVSQAESEKNDDGATFGQSLLHFMTLATGSVKTALQKPANYKKNINHRRYLQKQLKICTRRKKRSPKARTGGKSKKGGNMKTAQSSATQWFHAGQTNYGELCMENQEFSAYNHLVLPYEASFHSLPTKEYPYQHFSTHNLNIQNGCHNLSYSGQEGTNVLAAQPPTDSNTTIFREDPLPDVLDAEQFLTGEELTHALDIKDLFVPERALQENESNETLMYPCTFDENMYNGFQTVPSTSSILSW